jgi:hypothetical protein
VTKKVVSVFIAFSCAASAKDLNSGDGFMKAKDKPKIKLMLDWNVVI